MAAQPSPLSPCRRLAQALRAWTAVVVPWRVQQTVTDSMHFQSRSFETSSEFLAAAKAMRAAELTLPTVTQLQLYALYKQATVGDAPALSSSVIDLAARAKWQAWDRLRGTSEVEAANEYIAVVSRELSASAASCSKEQSTSSRQAKPLGSFEEDSDDSLAGLGDPDEPDALSEAMGTIGGPGSVSRMVAAEEQFSEMQLEHVSTYAPLHAAARTGDTNACEAHLKSGTPVDEVDEEGHTALHWAADAGNVEVVRLLLDSAADPGAHNCEGSTPLHMACAASQLDTAKLLIERGADCNSADVDGDTPLGYADETMASQLRELIAKDRMM